MSDASIIDKIRHWGYARKIIGPLRECTFEQQKLKLQEECTELIEACDLPTRMDAIGDITVVLVLMADMLGVTFEDCLEAAYNEIKDRRGEIVNGVFVKEAK